MPEKKPIINRLDSQKRDRGASYYVEDLSLDYHVPLGRDVLLVGGGIGCYQDGFLCDETLRKFDYTNIDLFVDSAGHNNPVVRNIQADFITYDKFVRGIFDEIWALYSLPLYAVSLEVVKLFYLKAMLYLKPGGMLRVCGPGTIAEFDRFRGLCGENYPEFRPLAEAERGILDFMVKMGMSVVYEYFDAGMHERLQIFKKPYDISGKAALSDEYNLFNKFADIEKFDRSLQNKIDAIMNHRPDMTHFVEVNDLFRKTTVAYNMKGAGR
ncbi:MAG: hypothetical protein LBH81_03150 [Rickettsiales bacterium]|jgi:hypothetical protein|nr:hypothetical protein [Rickettsiales bacterium]